MGKFDDAPEWPLIEAQRRRLADVFAGLSEEQLHTPSLCAAWQVRDVLGHLVAPFELSMPRMLAQVVRRGGFNPAMERIAKELGARPRDALVATLRANAAHRFRPPGGGPIFPLTDVTIHALDALLPLGMAERSSDEIVARVLDFLVGKDATKGFVKKGRFDGLRLEASDLDRSWGSGLTVRGPANALLLAGTGRQRGFVDLEGDGVDLLASRP